MNVLLSSSANRKFTYYLQYFCVLTMTDDNTNWRTSNFRQNVVQKINEAILQTGTSSSRNGIEMEQHAFQKAKNKDEYLAFVARLILHVREMNSKNKNPQNIGDVNNAGGPGMPDPINALQNMASPGTRNPQMMGMPGTGPAGSGNMGVGGNIPASNLLQTLTQQRPGQQNPQQQQMNQQNMGRGGPMLGQVGGPLQCNNMQPNNNMGGAGNAGGQAVGNQMNPGNMNIGMNSNQMNVGNQPNQMVGGMPNQMNQMSGNQMNMNPGGMGQNNPQMSGMGNMNQMNPMQNQMVNQMSMGQMGGGGGINVGGMVGQMNTINPNSINQMNSNPNQTGIVGQPQQQQQQQQQQQGNHMGGIGPQGGMGPQNQMNVPPNTQMTPNQILSMQQGLVRKPPEMMMNNAGNVFPGVRNVAPSQFLSQSPSPSVPSPVGMNPNPSCTMVSSPAHVPSPSPQMGNLMSGQQRVVGGCIGMAPSPSSNLSTPGQPGAVPSPLNPQEEQLYREKYRQLTKYIEPLKRMIARMGNDDIEKLHKMNRLLDILCNPNKRIPLETLVKCEKALEKMDFKSNVSLPLKEHPTNNPLLEAVSATLQSQLGNHTLQRTFNPCLESLFGPDIKNLPPAEKRPRYSTEDTSSSAGPVIPHTMQGEIARLDQKFKVSLDTSVQPGTKTLKLICCLDDKHLPCVPPVTVSIPEDYPASAPNCNLIEQEYSATPFLASVQKALTSRISKLPRQFSLSHLLDTWEMSVRQACSPNAVAASQATVLLGI